MTKYVKSVEALPSNLHLWETVHTQTGIVETKTLDVYSTTSIEASDTLTFVIPAMSKMMLQKVQIVSEIRVLTSADANPPENHPVSTAPHLAAALYRNVEIVAGSTSLVQSFDNAYAMAKFWETTLNTTSGCQPHLHSREGYYIDSVHSKAASENVDYFPTTGKATNGGGHSRAKHIAQGKKVCLISDLDASIFKQDKLLPAELGITVTLTKNYSEFILLEADNHTEKVKFDKIVLRCTFQRPQDSILNIIEERLAKENAIYHTDRSVLSFHTIPEGSTDLTISPIFGQFPQCSCLLNVVIVLTVYIYMVAYTMST